MRDVAAAVSQLSNDQIRAIESGGMFTFDEFAFGKDDIIIRRTERHGYALKSDGHMTVALDTELTPELEAEGMAREVVHHIQNLRKQEGLEITDRIAVALNTESASLRGALQQYQDYISRETLAREVTFKNGVDGASLDSNGHVFTVKIRRLHEPAPTNVIEH